VTLCLAVDGHDGSGKTTLARGLAGALGAGYCRPFSGVPGGRFLAESEAGRPHAAIRIAEAAVSEALQGFGPADVVVCDRLWITVLSVLPPDLFDVWTYRAPSLLCWSDLATTTARLRSRPEKQEALDWHHGYLPKYLDIAERFACPVLRTDQLGVAATLAAAEAWARTIMAAAEPSGA
jgi:hypothetical protein